MKSPSGVFDGSYENLQTLSPQWPMTPIYIIYILVLVTVDKTDVSFLYKCKDSKQNLNIFYHLDNALKPVLLYAADSYSQQMPFHLS